MHQTSAVWGVLIAHRTRHAPIGTQRDQALRQCSRCIDARCAVMLRRLLHCAIHGDTPSCIVLLQSCFACRRHVLPSAVSHLLLLLLLLPHVLQRTPSGCSARSGVSTDLCLIRPAAHCQIRTIPVAGGTHRA